MNRCKLILSFVVMLIMIFGVQGKASDKEVFGPHPRIYFRGEDIPNILANREKEQNKIAWNRHLENIKNARIATATNGAYDPALLEIIESCAFDYAVFNNEEAGERARSLIKDYLNVAQYADLTQFDYNSQGHLIYVISIVYDWCYPIVPEEDKQYFIQEIESIASNMEFGYPVEKQGTFNNHGSEAQVLRDMMCAAIAVYDENPSIWENISARFFDEAINQRKFFNSAHMLLQGSSYTGYRVQWDSLSTWILDRIGYPNIFSNNQEKILYWLLYARRPDGQFLRDGDTDENNSPIGTYNTKAYRAFLHTGNYYKEPYLKREGLKQLSKIGGIQPVRSNQTLSCVEYLILNNPDLFGKIIEDLPLTKYFPKPKGGMIARTGWEEGILSPSVVAEMKINQYNTEAHQHLDAGAFQIYYKGALATDSGYYQASDEGSLTENSGNTMAGSLHFYNYNRRTVAHNCILIFDPDEPLSNFGEYVNDGGQRMMRSGPILTLEQLLGNPGSKVGEVLGHEYGLDPVKPNYTYLKGDLRYAYSEKVSAYERSFLFLNLKNQEVPAALLVFDRVVSSSPYFKKSWLIHGLHEPQITENKTVFTDTRPTNSNESYNGKMVVDTLLPQKDNLNLTVVGGEGYEHWVNGTNYKGTPLDGAGVRLANEGGGYRVEISPKTPSQMDYFLNVIQIGDAQPSMTPFAGEKIETAQFVGAKIADRVVLFGKFQHRTKQDIEFSFSGEGAFEILLADLEEGTWEVKRNGADYGKVVVSKDGGVAAFTAPSGNFKLSYLNHISGNRTYTLTVNSLGNGSVSQTGQTLIKENSTRVFQIEPDPGYVIHEIMWNGAEIASVSSFGGEYQTPRITSDSLLEVTFKKDTNLVRIHSPGIYQGSYYLPELKRLLNGQEYEKIQNHPTLLSFSVLSGISDPITLKDYGVILSDTLREPELFQDFCRTISIKKQNYSVQDGKIKFGLLVYGNYLKPGQEYFIRGYTIQENGDQEELLYSETRSTTAMVAIEPDLAIWMDQNGFKSSLILPFAMNHKNLSDFLIGTGYSNNSILPFELSE